MSAAKFAAITSGLLARKGEAAPSDERHFLPWRSEPPAPAEYAPRPVTEGAGKIRKCAVRLSPQDHERLGIIAVKRGTTRQHLLQEAVETFLVRARLSYRDGCACLADAGPCCSPQPAP